MRLHRIFNLAFASSFAALTAAASSADAFSTGGHFRATEQGLHATTLGQGAIDLVQIANYQTDFIVNKPTWTEFAAAEKVGRVAQYFHFDDLQTSDDLERNLAWMEVAAHRMALNGKNANNPEMSLNGLGMVLHAIQDAYSHTNLADKNWPAFVGQRIVTFDDLPEDLWKSPALKDTFDPSPAAGTLLGVFGGNAGASTLYGTPIPQNALDWPQHGGDEFCQGTAVQCGLNHDSVHRRNSLVSEEMAIRATTQWANKFRAWVGDAFWLQMAAYSGSFVSECLGKMQETASNAGEWAYPTLPGGATRDIKEVDWAVFGDGCNWDWQDNRWSSVILDAFETVVPDHFVIDHVTTHSEIYPPASQPVFQIPSGAAIAPVFFAGAYDVTWGAQSGVLSISTAGAAVRATLTLGSSAPIALGTVVPKGNALDLDAAPYSAKIFLMAETRDAIAGFVRNEQGVPNGIFGTKRPIVFQPPVIFGPLSSL